MLTCFLRCYGYVFKMEVNHHSITVIKDTKYGTKSYGRTCDLS